MNSWKINKDELNELVNDINEIITQTSAQTDQGSGQS